MRSLPHAQVTSLLTCLLALLAAAAPAAAQNVAPDDVPAVIAPPKSTKKEQDRRESLYKFTEGVKLENQERLVEALEAFKEAGRLDPDAAPVFKAQVRVLVALNSVPGALEANRRVLELTPDDVEARFIQARLCKMLGKIAEAKDTLRQGLATPAVKDHPELAHQMAFDLGTMLESEKAYHDAAEAFARAVAVLEHPQHSLELGLRSEIIQSRIAEVCDRMGGIYLKDQQYEKAVAAYRKAQEKAPEIARKISFSIAQVYLEQGKAAEALAAVEDYLRQRPQGTEAYQMKITLLRRLGRDSEVLPWLEGASRDDNFNNSLRLLLAGQYAQARQYDAAEKIYLDMHAASPDVDVYRGLFGIYRREGTAGVNRLLQMLNKVFDEATSGDGPNIAQAQGRGMLPALREDADLSRQLVRVGLEGLETRKDLSWRTLDFVAVLAERHHQFADAERFYRVCIRNLETAQAGAPVRTSGLPGLAPPPSSEKSDLTLVQHGLLRVLFKARKFDAVERLCKELLPAAQGQERLGLLDERARALARADRYPEALACLDEAIRSTTEARVKMELQFTRINLLAQKGDHAQAENECRALLDAATLPSEMVMIRLQLSNIYSAAHQNDKAQEQLQWVLRFEPNHAGANNDLGYLWADQNRNLKEAEEMIRRALDASREERKRGATLTREEDQDHAAYIDSLGWVLYRQGKFEAARKELERASSQPDGDDFVIFDHLGDVYYQLRMLPQARAAWQKALQLFERDHIRNQDDRRRELERKVNLQN